MRKVRTDRTEIKKGVEVAMLFTPRLYAFNGVQGVTMKADTTDLMQVYALYADIMFCAALNLWTLEGNDIDKAPFTRVDFHEFSAANPQEFGRVLNFALEALSGKSMKDFWWAGGGGHHCTFEFLPPLKKKKKKKLLSASSLP